MKGAVVYSAPGRSLRCEGHLAVSDSWWPLLSAVADADSEK